ncbi:hypothetical protein DFQ28_010183 [Apophysomyces sp. BC1034]|nr:hypothetical protein DFQ29_008007 [Apophysomyces sp. BC1021]KAG0192094.1 hypothetical protein DFQ28_010183 [Apophysomyces sp. BC1034]
MPNNLESRLLKEWKDALQDPTMKPFVKCLYQLPIKSSKAIKEAYEPIDTSSKALKPDIAVSKKGHEHIVGEVKPKHKYFAVYTELGLINPD